MVTFKDLPLSPAMLEALEKLGFSVPTEIQAQAIPLLLSSQKIDFHGQAQTGTGKTLAFGIPLLEHIDKANKQPQVMIVAPTRELAVQIFESLKKIASPMGICINVIYGGVSLEEQIKGLKKGAQILVGTPGRLHDHLRRKTLDPRTIKTLVLDEADIMLDMGFKEDIEHLIKFLPLERQIWLFSATVKAGIADIMKKHMKDTVSVRMTPLAVTTSQTKQYYCIVPFRSRIHAITRFIKSVGDFYGFIFCQTKMLAAEVSEELLKRGYNVAALHGDLSQNQRNRVSKKFRQREITILVATDVAARGIDIPNITHVINYTIPDDLESYVHRVGRTGRAGKEGIAITLINRTEQRIIKNIERRFGAQIEPIDVPSAHDAISKRLNEIPLYIARSQSDQVPHQEALSQLVLTLNEKQLRQVTTHLLYDAFLGKLDLEEVPFTHVEDDGQFQEIFLNVGLDDGIKEADIRKYLLDTSVVTSEQIKKIRIIKQRTYVKLSSDCSPDLVRSLRDKKLHGRVVHVNVTCMIRDSGQGRSELRRSKNDHSQRRRRR